MNKSTKFNSDWLRDPLFSSWIGVDPNSNVRACCLVCGVKIELGNMGRQALTSHSKGKKHMNKIKMSMTIKQGSPTLDGFLVKHSTSDQNVPESITTSEVDASQLNVPPPSPVRTSSLAQQGQCTKKKTITDNVANDSVLSAEIVWALKTVTSHYSCSSSAHTNTLF